MYENSIFHIAALLGFVALIVWALKLQREKRFMQQLVHALIRTESAVIWASWSHTLIDVLRVLGWHVQVERSCQQSREKLDFGKLVKELSSYAPLEISISLKSPQETHIIIKSTCAEDTVKLLQQTFVQQSAKINISVRLTVKGELK